MLVGKPVRGHHPVVWGIERSNAKIIKIQYMVAIIDHQLADQNTTKNRGVCDEQDMWGECDAIILGAL